MDGACDATMKIKACSGEDNEKRKTHCWVNFYSHHKVFIPHMMWLVKKL